MKYWILFCALFFVTQKATTQGSEEVINKLIGKITEELNDTYEITTLKDSSNAPIKVDSKHLLNYLNLIKAYISKEEKIGGKLEFGFNLNTAENNELAQFDIATKFNRGTYPSTISFNTKLQIQLANRELIENFSELSFAYEHYLQTRDKNEALNGTTFQGYTYLKRISNSFLNIDQRYQAGMGLSINLHVSGNQIDDSGNPKGLTRNGKKKLKELNSANNQTVNAFGTNIIACTDSICKELNFTEKERELYNDSHKRINDAIKIRESIHKVSLALGASYEIESTKDSLGLFYEKSTKARSFENTSIGRINIGPKWLLKINEFQFETECVYNLKFTDGSIKDHISKILNSETYSDSKVDYRLNWSTTAKVTISKNTAITFNFNLIYLNAPRRDFFNINSEDTTLPVDIQLFESPNLHKYFKLGFEMTL